MTRRVFTAIRIPEPLHLRLSAMQAGVPGAKWVKPENFHITLGFVGDVEERRLDDLHDILSGIDARGFDLTLQGTGTFGSPASKMLWAGVRVSPALEHLQAAMTGRLVRGGFLEEARKYSPHVTLAYMERGRKGAHSMAGPGVASWLDQTAGFPGPTFSVSQFTLIESQPGRRGRSYLDMADYPLSP